MKYLVFSQTHSQQAIVTTLSNHWFLPPTFYFLSFVSGVFQYGSKAFFVCSIILNVLFLFAM